MLEEVTALSGVSRARAFEDFLEMTLCSLSGGRMEERYLEVVAAHARGEKGQRGCDRIAQMFGETVRQMKDEPGEMIDTLGDLFQGGITYGEKGQFLTPMPVARAMARMTLVDFEPPEDRRPAVCDPCCGSGRMLLAVAEQHRDFDFVGMDVDLRCVFMTAINLGLRNLYGYVVHANTLTLETFRAYRTGFNLAGGVIKQVNLEDCPAPVQQAVKQKSQQSDEEPRKLPRGTGPGQQLDLF